MPRRFFKSLNRQRHHWRAHWFMRPFGAWLENPAYWSLNRRSVTRAFALGLFVAFVPLPINALIATALALVLRVNIPAAVIGTFLTNPLTYVPLFVFAYWLGCSVLTVSPKPIHLEMSWEWLTTQLLPIWKPFLLGCLIMGATAAVLGYVLLGGVWHLTLMARYRQRKPPSSER